MIDLKRANVGKSHDSFQKAKMKELWDNLADTEWENL